MIRKIIKIDKEKCNGCGACAAACHENAIGMIDGKATLLRDDYCDGLGDCLPTCPTGAITFEEREAAAYDEAAVKANMAKRAAETERQKEALACGCPGTMAKSIKRTEEAVCCADSVPQESQLLQWPVQIKLLPVKAPYFDGAKLLVAADCTAYAYGSFHKDFMKDHITVIGCPKLDMNDYSEKLEEMLKQNDIKSVTIVRMEVPCCGGMEAAVKKALQGSGKFLPWQVVTIGTDGSIIH